MTTETKRQSAFTLLEISITLFIFALIIASSLMALNKYLSLLQTSRDINIAISDLRAAAEDVRRELDSTATIISRNYPLSNINATETVTIAADTTQNPVPVTISVTWQEESQRQRSATCDMLLTIRAR
jgi:prepilin-type N-terminal cleavage/methylation domain-containing protein